jgi:hypothetical protein
VLELYGIVLSWVVCCDQSGCVMFSYIFCLPVQAELNGWATNPQAIVG